MVQVTVAEPGKRRKRQQQATSRQGPANSALASILILVVFLSALFFGGVNPFFWGAIAVVLGAAAVWYSMTLNLSGERFRIRMSQMRLQTLLFALLCGFLLIQVLPFGMLRGPVAVATGVSASVDADTISIAPYATILMLLRQLSFGLFFFLMVQVSANEGRRRMMTNVLLIMLVGFAALGIVSLQFGDTVLGIPKKSYQGSVTGSFINRNSFATFLGFGAIVALGKFGAIIVAQRQRHANDGYVPGLGSSTVMYATSYAILIGTVIATQSRMGLAATIVASVLVGLIIMWKATLNMVATLAITLAAILGLGLGLLFYGQNLLDRVIFSGLDAVQRNELYAQVWELIRRRPWTGYGGGSFELAFPLVHRYPLATSVIWDKAHSTYLTLWSELGLVAGSLPIVLLAAVAWRLISAIRRETSNWMSPTIALGALVLGAVHSTVDFSLEIQANAFFLLALLGMGVASTYQPQK